MSGGPVWRVNMLKPKANAPMKYKFDHYWNRDDQAIDDLGDDANPESAVAQPRCLRSESNRALSKFLRRRSVCTPRRSSRCPPCTVSSAGTSLRHSLQMTWPRRYKAVESVGRDRRCWNTDIRQWLPLLHALRANERGRLNDAFAREMLEVGFVHWPGLLSGVCVEPLHSFFARITRVSQIMSWSARFWLSNAARTNPSPHGIGLTY